METCSSIFALTAELTYRKLFDVSVPWWADDDMDVYPEVAV